MIVIARFIEGVSLNGYEFVLTEQGEIMKFASNEDAMKFLTEQTGVEYSETIGWEENEGIYFINEEDIENK